MGLAFSVPEGIQVPSSLVNIFKELQQDLGCSIPSHGNLERWAVQGVLLLNTVLTGAKLQQLEREKGIVIRFTIGHSVTSKSILDLAIDLEESHHNDFLRLEHIEGYHELICKNKDIFFHRSCQMGCRVLCEGMLATTLARHRLKPRVYIGCMKSRPVLAQKNMKYHEPEYWKFGEEGNKYFRHASGQIYAISRDLATYISINQ